MACRKAFNVEDPTVDIQKKLSKYKEVLQGSEYARPLFAYLYDLLKSGITKKDEILLSLFDETLSIKAAKKNLRELISYMNCLVSFSKTDWVDAYLIQTTAEDR